MDTNQFAAFGYAVALIVYALLTILLLSGWRRSDQSWLPALATGINLLWAGVWIAGYLDLTRANAIVATVEWARGLAWLSAALAIFRETTRSNIGRKLLSRYGAFVLLLATLPVGYLLFRSNDSPATIVWVAGSYALSLLIVLVAEQLYRNAPVDSRSGITYLCIAIAGIFVFDLILYGLIIAGATTGPEYWAARGFVNALLAAPLVLGTWRRSRMSSAAQIPRQIAFYSFGITIMAVYVVLVVIGHHYVKTYGGSWSDVGGIVLIAAAIIAAVVIVASKRTRARVRVFLMKTFLQYKYDYRKEWLRFISTLSESGLEDVAVTAVRAVAQIVDSPGGVVWIHEQESNTFLPAGSWHSPIPSNSPITEKSNLVRFLKGRQWVIDLKEMQKYPDRYEDLQLDSWLQDDDEWWLIVPLFLGKRLYGFIVLQKPRVVPELNFEDHDLLRTAGSHVGMHINQGETDKRMAESRQFGAYNRLTAFLMHDLNNLLAQQSLVVKNAERFRNNPKFVDDAFETIAHSVIRMKRLIGQLSSQSKRPAARQTDVRDVLKQAFTRCQTSRPEPKLQLDDQSMSIHADSERLITVFEHVIRNAQDATPEQGSILVNATASEGWVTVSIADTGEGMTPEFIRERLFRPFDSTKGSERMGIGAYQARDYVRTLGGQMEVSSEIGVGTTFTVRLPATRS
jgi:putative PEP-CTERM system histidine kinase